MRAIKYIAISSILLVLAASCHKEKHFISDKEYREQVHSDFLVRKELASGRADALFGGMDTLNTETREALEFLYAYMPYSDLADYDQSFYLQQINTAFQTKELFSWGKKIPEDIFRHFVLVYRVNNENLDTARLLMQRELTPRIENMSMYDAALEVNHWCHEHVAYRASDSRTSAPLATMRTSLGRCGEESTFTVTALRSVGIPARQCYTPRWAHCDDNHAWVEVFIADSNRWFFLGACEPDPELDMGWFSVPSTRCMMVHSKAFGRYHGDEEVVRQTSLFSELNLLSHYAPTKKITVTVFNADNKPVENADVKFKLYNYSEFYTLATIKTDGNGKASLTTGLGDLQIWATDGENYNYIILDARKQNNTEIYLTRKNNNEYTELLDIVPPVAGEAKVTPSEEKSLVNEKRKAYEDSLRGAYTATFPTKENFSKLLKPTKNLTQEEAWTIIQKAEGNYAEIAKFINNHADENLIDDIEFCCICEGSTSEHIVTHHLFEYLSTFSDKDLRDITAETLESHWRKPPVSSLLATYDEVYLKGIMPARISNEMVRPWREFLAEKLSDIKDINSLIAWTKENIAVDDSGNYYNCPISPKGVYELRHSDAHSRDIFFVAACRSLGIPAYLDNATNTIYVNDGIQENLWQKGKWSTVSFETDKSANQPTAKLKLTYKPTKELAKPVYWPHFTLARYEKGDFVTFDFEDDDRMSNFPATIDLEPGYYRLMTGNRYSDGKVLVRADYFSINPGDKANKEIILRPLTTTTATVLGKIDASQSLGITTLEDYAGNTGMIFVFLGDYKEPSKHLVKEIQALKKEYEDWGGMIYLVAPSSAKPLSWKLPNTDCSIREAGQKDSFETQITKALKINLKNDYPLVAAVNSHGEILFCSHGYSIGLAEQLLKAVK